MNSPFEITREEVIDLAARKLIDGFGCGTESGIQERAEAIIRESVSTLFSAQNIKHKIDAALTDEMERLLSSEVHPVNIFGEREGQPTTIRAALAERAKQFWNVKVDDSGKDTGSYYGEERSTRLMKQLLKDEFSKAVKENADVIVAAFKQSLIAESSKMVTDHINRLIK